MEIKVIEPYPLDLSIYGGGGKVLIGILETLKNRGYEITLYSPFASSHVVEKLRRLSNNIKTMSFNERFIKIFTNHAILGLSAVRLYNLYVTLFSNMVFKDNDYTIISTYDSLIGEYDFGYIHYPSRRFFSLRELDKIKCIVDFFDYLTSFPFKKFAKILVANSSWTAKLTEAKIGKKVHVLYPPVDLVSCNSLYNKEDLVVSVGRIVEDKRYEDVLYTAEKLKNIKFVIIGRVQQMNYYKSLLKRAPDNVTFLTNVPEETKMTILCKAKVLLHTKMNEPFGIAIVEGMSAEAIPVVHKSGGAWEDIVEKGKFGFGYKELEELPEVVKQAIGSKIEVRIKALEFSNENFKNNFLKLTNL